MVVNSLNFLLFFTVFFIGYYLPVSRNNARVRNAWLLLGSYFFYGVADWKMLPLLFGATVVFYGLGLWLKSEMVNGHTKAASRITTLGVVLGVAILLYFKYLNFFAESFAALLNWIGLNVTWTTLNIVLPIGVSFFTFKLISYIIEVHREHFDPCKDFIHFGAYVAFFPTILSGPIDRPNCLIPQLGGAKRFDYALAVDGCRQILWGMFIKMCIADNLSKVTDDAWIGISDQRASTLVIAALFYLIQMYADFDGYSNMAIGVGKLLGIKIARNFNHPLLARNTAEYWRKWHISLTSWITDYIFMPLNIAFRNYGNIGICLACMINMVVIGLWHGANWTFALFGVYHGILFIPLVYSGTFGKNKKLKATKSGHPFFKDVARMLLTYFLVALGLVMFRAESVSQCFAFLSHCMDKSIMALPHISIIPHKVVFVFAFIALQIVLEWTCRSKEHPLQFNTTGIFSHATSRYMVYFLLFVSIVILQGSSVQFIYFQF